MRTLWVSKNLSAARRPRPVFTVAAIDGRATAAETDMRGLAYRGSAFEAFQRARPSRFSGGNAFAPHCRLGSGTSAEGPSALGIHEPSHKRQLSKPRPMRGRAGLG
jgi:hypothetical protein